MLKRAQVRKRVADVLDAEDIRLAERALDVFENARISERFGFHSVDSFRGFGWVDFLEPGRLESCFRAENPFAGYHEPEFLRGLGGLEGGVPPHYSTWDFFSRILFRLLIDGCVVDGKTALVLDSGGPHSVAMALEAARTLGHSPVNKIRACAGEPGYTAVTSLGSFLYFAREMDDLKKKGKLSETPAFILDLHRTPSYVYANSDFPSASELKGEGVGSLVYVRESGNPDIVFEEGPGVLGKNDLESVLEGYSRDGIKVRSFVHTPLPRLTHYLRKPFEEALGKINPTEEDQGILLLAEAAVKLKYGSHVFAGNERDMLLLEMYSHLGRASVEERTKRITSRFCDIVSEIPQEPRVDAACAVLAQLMQERGRDWPNTVLRRSSIKASESGGKFFLKQGRRSFEIKTPQIVL